MYYKVKTVEKNSKVTTFSFEAQTHRETYNESEHKVSIFGIKNSIKEEDASQMDIDLKTNYHEIYVMNNEGKTIDKIFSSHSSFKNL